MITANARRIAILAGLILSAGCAATPEETDQDDERVDQEAEPVINGTPFVGTDRLVLVITSSGGCTGTMITNSWVLTAAHCGAAVGAPNQTSVTLNTDGNSPQTRVGARVVSHPSLDLSLILLQSPMTINGSTTGFQSSMYTGPAEDLSGQAIEIQGFGNNNCNNTGFGVLRKGTMMASSFPDQYNITYTPWNNNGVSAGAGDSGGPFWKFFNGVAFQVSVEKAGACGAVSYAARPENFEQWVFEVVYNTPVHIPTTDPQGRGLWYLAGSSNPDFWERPLKNGWFQYTPYFDPCPGSGNDYTVTASYTLQGSDNLFFASNYANKTLTGSGTTTAPGNGPMFVGYSTGQGTASPGMTSMTVQCNYGAQSAALVCHGARCGTTRDPLPNNFSQSVAWNPCGGGAFWYFLDYDTEQSYDFVTIAGKPYTGKGSASWVYVNGATQVQVTTDYSVQSHGIRSLKAECYGWEPIIQ